MTHYPSMHWFNFPALTQPVWLNQSDRLCVPGESLSAVPFLLGITLPVTNALRHLSPCSTCSQPLSFHHTHTQMYVHTRHPSPSVPVLLSLNVLMKQLACTNCALAVFCGTQLFNQLLLGDTQINYGCVLWSLSSVTSILFRLIIKAAR